MMTADLTVWQALHEQDEQEKKEVVAIRFVDDLLSEKEVALLANKKAINKKNRKREQLMFVAQMMFFACLLPLHLCMATFDFVGHNSMHSFCLLLHMHM